MNTTGLVMTVTDELLREFDSIAEYDDDDNKPVAELRSVVCRLTSELRRLRAENAELARVVKDVRWRIADTTDQLQAYGHNGDRLYGLDEWSVPIRNLNIAIGMLEKATQ